MHQVVDHRELADAIVAVVAAPPHQPVLNVASATYTEEELAEFVAVLARRTDWEWLAEGRETGQPVMSTELIQSALGWEGSAATAREGLRALAQWLACDVHNDIPRIRQEA
jgi:nucleoside-diphosphate-sugar epimerase